jgi:phosphoadenosine phosphosulfate reductase
VASGFSGGMGAAPEVARGQGSSEQLAVQQLNDAARALSPVERLRLLRECVRGTLIFTTSFGLEDQVLTHFVGAACVSLRYVTLDTGRLFPETYGVWAATEQRYSIRIEAYCPEAAAVERLVNSQGIDGFYSSLAARHACCAIRKVAPLRRALRGAAGWLTGLRADQSDERRDVAFAVYDGEHELIKVSPLYDWSRDRLAAEAVAAGIPLSPLHERGFKSIGCAPCTRAVGPGEPERAGRWWWETATAKECGLHLAPDGRLVRAAGAP